MRKFKLIKEYPGSSSLGTIFHIGGFAGDVSKYPEFFEEVIEKDYEILESCPIEGSIYSVKRLSDGEVFTVGDLIKTPYTDCTPIIGFNTKYSTEYFIEVSTGFTRLLNLEKVIEKDYEIISYFAKDNPKMITIKRRGGELHDSYWKIHSVKRLSDGEIFTVGDSVKVYEYGSVKTIDSMDLVTKCSSMKQGIWLNYSTGSSHISHATKQKKQPIFLTHDGKDIFEGDKLWYVNKESLNLDHFQTHANVTFCSNINAYFLTQKEAQDYIIENKPSLSIKEFWEITCLPLSNAAKSVVLEELAKKRLNLK